MDKKFVNSNGRAENWKYSLGIGNKYEHLTKSCLLGYPNSFNDVKFRLKKLSNDQKDVILFAAAS